MLDMFDDFWRNGFDLPTNTSIGNLDAKEEDGHYLIRVDVPGLSKDEIDISVRNGILTIGTTKDEKNEESNSNYFIRERRSQSFSRSLKLPPVDENSIEATLKDGVLTVAIRKNDGEKTRKKIEVKSV